MDRCDICKHQDGCVSVPYGCECFEIDLAKHDAQVRADVIEKIISECQRFRNQFKTFYYNDFIRIANKLKERLND